MNKNIIKSYERLLAEFTKCDIEITYSKDFKYVYCKDHTNSRCLWELTPGCGCKTVNEVIERWMLGNGYSGSDVVELFFGKRKRAKIGNADEHGK